VEYSLLSGLTEFRIDSQSGLITLAKFLSTFPVIYTITVRASDKGQPQRSVSQSITIIVSSAVGSGLQVSFISLSWSSLHRYIILYVYPLAQCGWLWESEFYIPLHRYTILYLGCLPRFPMTRFEVWEDWAESGHDRSVGKEMYLTACQLPGVMGHESGVRGHGGRWTVLRWFPFAFLGFLVGVNKPKPFVYTSPANNSTTLNENGGVNIWQPASDLDPNYPLVGPSIIFTMVILSPASNLEWEAR